MWTAGRRTTPVPSSAAAWFSIGCVGVQTFFWLAGPEGDDAADRIVRRHADGQAISGNNLDSEAAHPSAQLGKHFVAGVALHAIQPAAVDRHNGPLHVNQIVLAQSASNPFSSTCHCIRGGA